MKYGLTLIFFSISLSACNPMQAVGTNIAAATGASSVTPGVTPNPTPSTAYIPPFNPSDRNVVPITVGCGYPNEPCVTVTVCNPTSGACVQVPDVLLDSGSFGLRIFSSTVSSLGLTGFTDTSGSQTLAECQSYMDGSSDWGPIAQAQVMLGSEKSSTVSVQLIDASFPGLPSGCTNPDSSPSNVGFNGILGVGVFVDDCGPGCATDAQNNAYYFCTSSSCSSVAVPENYQVSNPIAFMPTDNNGLAIQLANLPNLEAVTSSGYMIMGIGTSSNNTPTGLNILTVDLNGNFITQFSGQTYNTSFIDSGSNSLNFPAPASLTVCSQSSNASGFFCPTTEQSFVATASGSSGGFPQVSIGFEIGNADAEFSQSNPNFDFEDLGAPDSDQFDWGLPFFYGRTVYVGFYSTGATGTIATSPLGAGPYWAF